MQKPPSASKSGRSRARTARASSGQASRETTRQQHRTHAKSSRPEKDVDLRAQSRDESRIYGINACLKYFEHRRESLVKVYLSERIAGKFGAVMKYCAAQHLVYRFVTDAELEKITASGHHEGVCFVIRKTPVLAAGKWLRVHGKRPRQLVLALEQVGNPHNLGAILRSCAHFGVTAVAVNDVASMMSGAAVRTAEGGAEYVEVIQYTRLEALVDDFRKAGFAIAVTSSHGGVDLYQANLPEKLLILFGEESGGLSRKALSAGDLRLMIPGTGQVESLNVSVACSLMLSEYWRRYPQSV